MHSGHTVVPPARSAMKSRRFIVPPALTANFFKCFKT
jgi:hypothetical protein